MSVLILQTTPAAINDITLKNIEFYVIQDLVLCQNKLLCFEVFIMTNCT